jgi:capsular polysaccharide biosynthesis protein
MTDQPDIAYPDFQYGPGQPNLYRLMRYKRDLIDCYGIQEGFASFRQCNRLAPEAELRRVALTREDAYARAHALRYVELKPAGESFEHPPPSVRGPGNHGTIRGVSRAFYVACLGNVDVMGRSALPVIDDTVIVDVQRHELGRLDDELDWDPIIFHAEASHVWRIPSVNHANPLVIDEAFNLLGAHTDFFGHWMYEYLPKLLAAILSDVLPQGVPLLIDAHMPPAHRESLALIAGDSHPIVEVPAFHTCCVRLLWLAPSLMYMPLHERTDHRDWGTTSAPPSRFAPILAEMRRRVARNVPTPTSTRLVYLARRLFRHRRLTNAEDIERVAAELGFTVAYPEDLPFSTQASLVLEAEVILAPEGSALYLGFLAMPGTQVGILSHPLTDALSDYNGLFATQRISTSVLTGPIETENPTAPHDSDYRIDPSEFGEFAAGLIAQAHVVRRRD